MENYELTIILDAKVTPVKKKAVLAIIEKMVTTYKGKMGKAEDWGVKDFAYKIGKNSSGYFLFFPLELEKESVKSLNLKLKMEKEILRYLLVRKGELRKNGKKS